jgi:hypothetical protein
MGIGGSDGAGAGTVAQPASNNRAARERRIKARAGKLPSRTTA